MATKERKLLKQTRGPRRLRPVPLHLGAALRDGLRRHEGPDLARLPQGLRRRRQGAAAADGLRLLRRAQRRELRLDASSACSTAASSTPSATSAAAAISARSGTTRARMLKKKNTFTDFIAVAETLDRRQVHVEGPPRHRGRLAPAACSWAPSRTCGPTSSRPSSRACRSSTSSTRCSTSRCR